LFLAGGRCRSAVTGTGDHCQRALAAAFDHLSEESRYRRFLHPVKELRPRDLAYFTELDHHDHEALIALTAEDEAVLSPDISGLVRISKAEFAIAVVDEWQGRGLGTELLVQLMVKARSEGVRRFTATALSDNREVRELVEHVAPVLSRRSSAGVTELEILLPPRPHLLFAESPLGGSPGDPS
jgi:GNAT superfamily N-acetyltransferase